MALSRHDGTSHMSVRCCERVIARAVHRRIRGRGQEDLRRAVPGAGHAPSRR